MNFSTVPSGLPDFCNTTHLYPPLQYTLGRVNWFYITMHLGQPNFIDVSNVQPMELKNNSQNQLKILFGNPGFDELSAKGGHTK